MKKILWLRNNLRVHNNPSLDIALNDNVDEAIVIIDEKLFNNCPNHLQFFLETLKELIPIFPIPVSIHNTDTIEYFKQNAMNISCVYSHLEFTFYETEIEKTLINSYGNKFHFIDSELLISQIPQNVSKHFTEFRKSVEDNLNVTTTPILTGNTSATKHLVDYVWNKKLPLTYKETRNFLSGDDYSTKFSKYLSVGALSARSVYSTIKEFEKENFSNSSTYWIIFELLWRDFFKLMAREHRNRFFHLNGYKKNASYFMRHSEEKFQLWSQGKTSHPFINAFMKEINHTGYMSNRGRQIVASFLIHDLLCDWRKGASYFESKLHDFDPALNWGNWAYIAGVGSDPRPSRRFNPDKQMEEHDPQREFVDYWLGL